VLNEVCEVSGVMTEGETFLAAVIQRECERVVPEVNDIRPQDAAETYIFLKTHFVNPTETVNI
jgi:hypothetical protein